MAVRDHRATIIIRLVLPPLLWEPGPWVGVTAIVSVTLNVSLDYQARFNSEAVVRGAQRLETVP